MNFLLDTHCWLWWLFEPEKLSDLAQETIADRKHQLYLSAASIWEIGIKYANGKLPLPQSPNQWISQQIAEDQLNVVDIKSTHAVEASALPLHHRDPFDRMLIAQSSLEQLVIITIDPYFSQYDIQVIW